MIVDCHIHSWRYPEHWSRDAMLKHQPKRRQDWTDEQFKQIWDNPIEMYLEVARGVVDKAILQGAISPNTFGVDVPNDYLKEVADQHSDMFQWCCCVDPTEDGAVEEIERCIKLGAIGVGELGPAYGEYYLNDSRCYRVWSRCEELGIPVVIHAGFGRHAPIRYADLTTLDDMATDFPDLKIVLCHMGFPQYEIGSFIVTKHPNVYADVSWLTGISGLDRRLISKYHPQVDYGYYFHLVYPLVYHLSQTYGDTDKLIFGTDWGNSTPGGDIKILENINDLTKKLNLPEIPEQVVHNLLHENWKKVFKLNT